MVTVKKIILVIVLAILFFCGLVVLYINNATSGQCDRLEALAEKQDIRDHLIGWVENQIVNSKISRAAVSPSPGRVPGLFLLKLEFDWAVLGMSPSAGQIRILGPRLEDGFPDLDNIQAVSISDRSRASILVRLPTSEGFGVESDRQDLTLTSPYVAVYCASD